MLLRKNAQVHSCYNSDAMVRTLLLNWPGCYIGVACGLTNANVSLYYSTEDVAWTPAEVVVYECPECVGRLGDGDRQCEADLVATKNRALDGIRRWRMDPAFLQIRMGRKKNIPGKNKISVSRNTLQGPVRVSRGRRGEKRGENGQRPPLQIGDPIVPVPEGQAEQDLAAPVFTRVLHQIRDVIPLDRILLETDAPYLPNPAHSVSFAGLIPRSIKIIAAIKNLPVEVVAKQLRENVRGCYAI